MRQSTLFPKKRSIDEISTPSGCACHSTAEQSDDVTSTQPKASSRSADNRNQKMKLIAAARRQYGLRHQTVLDNPWLRCTHKFEADPEDKDDRGFPGVKYFGDDDRELSADEVEKHVRWNCGPCTDYAATCSKPPSAPGKLTKGGRSHSEMKRPDAITNHRGSQAKPNLFHQDAVKHEQDVQEGKDEEHRQQELTALLKPQRELQANYLLAVLFTAIFEQALALVRPLRNLGSAWGVSMPPDMSHRTILELLSAAAEFFRRRQRRRFFLAQVFGALGDGGTDISTQEYEFIGGRISWEGAPRNEFIKVAEMDLTKSRDGESPDAQCLEASYDVTMTELYSGTTGDAECDKFIAGFKIQPKDWMHRMVCASLDGASVNSGHKNGLIALWKAKCDWVYLIHAVAHVLELKAANAMSVVPYYEEDVDNICRSVVSAYNRSSKKQANCLRIANELGEEKHLRLVKFSATRYQRHFSNSLRALLVNWRAIAIQQHTLAHQQVITSKADKAEFLSLSSPLESFVGKSYFRQFTGYARQYAMHITGVVPPVGEENDFNRPRLEAKVVPARESYQQEPLYKSEVVDQLDPTDRLQNNPSYEIYNNLTSARFVKSSHFLMDAKEPIARLSELTQRDDLSLKSLDRKLKGVKAEMAQLKSTPGENEGKFVKEYDSEREIYRGIQVLNEGLEEADADRTTYLDAIAEELDAPELTLPGPLHGARRELFDYDSWPEEYEAGYFEPHLKQMAKHYEFMFKLWCGDQYLAQLLRQWRSVVLYVLEQKKHWKKLGYKRVWQKACLSDDMEPAARLLLKIEHSTALDTSCVERWIGLMGRIKAVRRNRMCLDVLNDLMFIRLHAPRCMLQLKELCPQIIQIWEAASKRGRYQSKWKLWESTLDQMNIDEELLSSEADLAEAFKEVDLELIRKSSYELQWK